MVPLVGISTSELRTPERVKRLREAEPPMRELALGLDYPRAVARAGGAPVVLPPMCDLARHALERCDALLLSGGPDIHPSLYGREPEPELGPTEPDLDQWESMLLRDAEVRGIPVLALCRGMQMLNVVRGGTLIQDLPGHRQEQRGWITTHEVDVDTGTRLSDSLMRSGRVRVNSFHHQAIDDLGQGLVVTARSCDDLGLVEAVEDPSRPFVVGVQWHAESLVGRPEHLGLFEALVRAASEAATTNAAGLAPRAA